jgi:putative ABC transport system permease protein
VITLLYKNTIVKIKKSFGRYISLLTIILVGVGFYTGIQASAPDIIHGVDVYYDDYSLMDYKVISTLGLTDEDAAAIQSLKNVEAVIPTYSLDVLDQGKAIKIHALEDTVNRVKLTQGRLPENETECVADGLTHNIGDKIIITSDVSEELKNTEYTVVGTITSPLYMVDDYGNTSIGDGKLSSFIFVNRSNFTLDAYTEIYIVGTGMKTRAAYSKEYEELAKILNNELVEIKPVRETARYDKIYNEAKAEIDENEAKLNNEKADAQEKLSEAKTELDDNMKKLKSAKEDLINGEKDLQQEKKTRKEEFDNGKEEISKGWKEINNALQSNGISRDELGTKINELGQALEGLKLQLAGVPKDSQEYAQLSETIKQYTTSYEGLLYLQSSITTLTKNETKLNNGIITFNTEIKKAEKKMADGKKEISENEKKLEDGYKEYNENLDKFNSEMKDATVKIEDAKVKLSEIEKAKWYIFDRDSVVGYSDLKNSADIIISVARVLPIFFILIVILMTSNTMARMIEEERGELGTLASLGFHNNSIIATYLMYILSATAFGVILGYFIGCNIIPGIIYSCFQFSLPPLIILYDIGSFIVILVLALALMATVTIVCCNKALKHIPATLLRPIPPKNGQTILLERVGIIWKHLSFTWKVTLRNIFRYKQRVFMTVIGIAGCTGLLLAGFGLKDSMNGVESKQYGEIFRYNELILLKDETKNISGELKELLTEEQVKDPTLIRQEIFTSEDDKRTIDAYLIVPENEDMFYNYYHLKDIQKEKDVTLSKEGVVITRKLAKTFKIDKGDTITIKDIDNNNYDLPVSEVVENYIMNYVYINKSLYNQIFGKEPAYNMIVSESSVDETVLAQNLIDSGLVVNVNFKSDILRKAIEGNDGLNNIIILIVCVAGILAVLVLYNLTSINISERRREIATLKVLGFTDGETNSYIYREAFILTLLSIGVGLVLGIFLHGFVLSLIESGNLSFLKNIHIVSFIYAAMITLIITIIMQAITYMKLTKIDMIESLKSVE